MSEQAYAFNSSAKYQTGGVYPVAHITAEQLTKPRIQVNLSGAFQTEFLNVFEKYRLPYVESDLVVQAWNSHPIQFWQNQVNFAVWCATSGCGVCSQKHLSDPDPLTQAVFRFHVYYQICRILKEIRAPLPQDQGWAAFENPYDVRAYERLCAEFGVSPNSDWRILGKNHGLGTVYNFWSYDNYHPIGSEYDPKSMSFTIANSTNQYLKVDYIAQDPIADTAWSTFIPDKSQGFTRPGIERINDSIRTYVWAILGGQGLTRTRILGTGTAFDAQKQYLSLVEDAISSPVDLAAAIRRYQDILQNAASKVDYVFGTGLYMCPSDMLLRIGQVSGYNNMIVVATASMKRGVNGGINISDAPVPPAVSPIRGPLPAHHEPEPAAARLPGTTSAAEAVAANQHQDEKTALVLGVVATGLFFLWWR